jgi:hypothetical protein
MKICSNVTQATHFSITGVQRSLVCDEARSPTRAIFVRERTLWSIHAALAPAQAEVSATVAVQITPGRQVNQPLPAGSPGATRLSLPAPLQWEVFGRPSRPATDGTQTVGTPAGDAGIGASAAATPAMDGLPSTGAAVVIPLVAGAGSLAPGCWSAAYCGGAWPATDEPSGLAPTGCAPKAECLITFRGRHLPASGLGN